MRAPRAPARGSRRGRARPRSWHERCSRSRRVRRGREGALRFARRYCRRCRRPLRPQRRTDDGAAWERSSPSTRSEARASAEFRAENRQWHERCQNTERVARRWRRRVPKMSRPTSTAAGAPGRAVVATTARLPGGRLPNRAARRGSGRPDSKLRLLAWESIRNSCGLPSSPQARFVTRFRSRGFQPVLRLPVAPR